MNTYTNAMHPKKEAHRTARNNLFHNTAIVMIILTLVATAAIAVYIANRPVAAAENNPPIPYGNALEMQYAQPWLDKAELATVVTGNGEERIPLNCSSSSEMLYACKYGYRQP